MDGIRVTFHLTERESLLIINVSDKCNHTLQINNIILYSRQYDPVLLASSSSIQSLHTVHVALCTYMPDVGYYE